MARAKLCDRCPNIEACKDAGSYCHAMNELFHVYDDSKKQIEDFYSTVDRLGTRWDMPDADIEDITEGVS